MEENKIEEKKPNPMRMATRNGRQSRRRGETAGRRNQEEEEHGERERAVTTRMRHDRFTLLFFFLSFSFCFLFIFFLSSSESSQLYAYIFVHFGFDVDFLSFITSDASAVFLVTVVTFFLSFLSDSLYVSGFPLFIILTNP